MSVVENGVGAAEGGNDGTSRKRGATPERGWRSYLTRLLPRRRRKRPETAPLSIESLEPRVVFDVAPPDSLVPTDRPVVGLVAAGIDGDATTDLAALDDQGKLHVALSNADGTRRTLAPQDLGVANPQGLVAGYFDGDRFADLVIVGSDGVSLARGDGAGRFAVVSTVAFPEAGKLAGAAINPHAATVGLFDDDVHADVAVIVPGAGEVWLLTGDGRGGLSSARRFGVGGTPTAIAAGNFVGDARADFAVGRADGSVAFLAGGPNGTFSLVSGSTVSLDGPVRGLATLDADGDGDLDLAATTATTAHVLDNADDPRPTPVVAGGDFSQGLTGWTTTGRVSALGGAAELREGPQLLTTLEQTLTLPADATTLSFDLVGWKIEGGLGLGPDDAFEVSLLDAEGNAVGPTWRPEATSFFNLGTGTTVNRAAGVSFDCRTVTLDVATLTNVPADRRVRLVFDLVGLPQGATSLAVVDNVRVDPLVVRDERFTPTTLGTLAAGAGIAAANLTGDGRTDLVVADGARLAVFANSASGFARSNADLSAVGSGATHVVAAPFAAGAAVAQVAVSSASPTGVLVVGGVVVDTLAPTASLVGATGGVLPPAASVVLQFSEPMRDAGPIAARSVSRPGAYSLQAAGADGLFGTSDDSSISFTLSYDATTNRATLSFAQTLAPGKYRVVVDGSPATGLVDLAGNPLGDGLGATLEFAVADGPTLAPIADVSGAEGALVALSAVVVVPPGGNAAGYTASVDWGDGSAVETVAVAFIAGAWTIAGTHRYRDDGEYQAIVRVLDPVSNRGDQQTARVLIGNVPPTLTPAAAATVTANQSASVTLATFLDPAWGETYTATVNWGDGSGVQSATVNVTPGSAGTPTTGSISGSHSYASPGTYTVVVTLTDGDSAPVSTTLPITVVAPETGLGSGPFVTPAITGVLRDDGASPSDATTTDRTLVIVGTAAPNSVVTITREGVGVIGTAIADENGDWSFDYTGTTLAEGSHVFGVSAAPLGPLGIAGQYSLFVLENLTTQNYTSVAGRVAVGGNANITGYGLGTSLAAGTAGDALVVGGDLNFSNGQVYQGNVVVAGTPTLAQNATIANGPLRREEVIDFAAVGQFLRNQSAAWDALPANGTTNYQWGGFTLTGTDATLNVFDVPASQLATTWGVTINVPAGSTVLVNVTGGSSAQMQHFGITLNGATADKLVWNFPDATTLSLNGIAVPGTVLAPKAAVTFNNGQVQGTLVAKSFTGSGSFQPGALSWTGAPRVGQPFTVTVVGPAAAPGKFQVVDALSGEVHRYGATGSAFGSTPVGSGNELRGVASDPAGGRMWVLDSTGKIFAYDGDGSLRGSWTAAALASPSDLALVGDDLFVVDSASDRVHRFAGGALWLSGTREATSSFALDSANGNATGLAARDGLLWVVDDGAASDRVFVYTTGGALQGSFAIDGANAAPTGITVDPAGGSEVWIVDAADAAVYRYDDATGLRSGGATAAGSFGLAAGNANPGGIADPPGAIELGQTYADSIDAAGEVDVWTFVASAGQAFRLDPLGSNDALYDDQGNRLDATGFGYEIVAPSGRIVRAGPFDDIHTPVVLTESGEHQFRVRSDDLGGAYEFRLVAAPVAGPAAVEFGVPVVRELSRPGEVAVFEFAGTTGGRVYFAGQSLYGKSVRIVAPSGATLLNAYGSAEAALDLTENGTHRIEIAAWLDQIDPAFAFTLWNSPIGDVETIAVGDFVSGDLTVPGQLDRYEFAATAGQRIYLDGTGTPSGGSVSYRLVAPSGQVALAAHFFHYQGVALTESGVYRLEITRGGGVGAYQFALVDVPVGPTRPLTLDQPTTGDLTVLGQLDRYSFAAVAGQRLYLEGVATGGAFDTLRYAIVNAAGETLAEHGFTSSEPVVLEAAGDYELHVWRGNDVGGYEFTLLDSPLADPVSVQLGARLTGELTRSGQVDRYEFVGVAGQVVTLRYEEDSATSPFVQLVDARGERLGAADGWIRLPADGVYRVEVAWRYGLGEYALRLRELPVAAPVPLGFEQIVEDSFAASGMRVYTFSAAAGAEVVFDVLSVTPTSGPVGDLRWRLAGPAADGFEGEELWEGFLYSEDSDQTVLLESGGAYTLLVYSLDDWTGSYRFQFLPPAEAPAIPIELDAPVAGEFLPGGQTQTYSFQVPAGGTFYFDRSDEAGTGSWRLTGPNGQDVFSDALADRGPLALAAGAYRLSVSSTGAGDYAFRVWNLVTPAPTPVVGGEPVDGTLALPSLVARHSIDVLAGQRLSLDLPGDGPAPGVTYTLRDASGDVVYSGQSIDRTVFVSETGSYTLEVARRDGTGFEFAREYRFTLHVADAPTPRPLAVEEATTVSFASSAEWAVFTFSGAAGQVLAVQSPGTYQILDPEGRPVEPQNARATLPVAGEYTLIVFAREAGDFTVKLWNERPATSETIALGANVVAATRIAGQIRDYVFAAEAGRSIYFDVASAGGAYAYTLLGPNGATLDAALGPDEFFTTAESGEYTLRVTALNFGEREVAFALRGLPATTTQNAALGQPVLGSTELATQRVEYTFAWAAGRELYFDRLRMDAAGAPITALDGDAITTLDPDPDHAFALYAPDGSLVLNTAAAGVRFLDDASVVLTQTGVYRLVVERVDRPFVPFAGVRHFGFQLLAVAATESGGNDSRGTDFWTAFPGQMPYTLFGASGPLEISVFIAGGATAATGTVTAPGVNFGAAFSVQPGEVVEVKLPAAHVFVPLGGFTIGVDLGGGTGIVDKAVRITADAEVSVVGWNHMPATGDSARALPTDVLGTEYVVPSWGNQRGYTGSQLTIVATEDDTTVSIVFGPDAGDQEGEVVAVTLKRGQAYLIQNGGDLTGTYVVADKPVAVLAGHQINNVPSTSFPAANHLIEQVPPLDTWGRSFTVVPFAGRDGDVVRVLAGDDRTEVRIDGTLVATLARGQYHQTTLAEAAQITTTGRALVTQFAQSTTVDGRIGDPTMVLVAADSQFAREHELVSIDSYGYTGHWITIVAPAAAIGQVTLDGELVDAAAFTPVGDGTHAAARIEVAVGRHTVSSPIAVATYVYGWGPMDAYGHAGNVTLTPAAVDASLTLSPGSKQRFLQDEHRVTASVRDDRNRPLAGVEVVFTVSGPNARSFTATTNAFGLASFVYTGVIDGRDEITATATVGGETLVGAASVEWGVLSPTIALDPVPEGLSLGDRFVFSGAAESRNPGGRIVQVLVNGRTVDALDATGRFWIEVETTTLGLYDVVALDSFGEEAFARGFVVRRAADFDGGATRVSADVGLVYSGTTYNRKTGTLLSDVRLHNGSTDAVVGVVAAAFSNFTAGVSLGNEDRRLEDGREAVLFDDELTDGRTLAAGATSAPALLAFEASGLRPFAYDVELLVAPNLAPRFATAPLASAAVGVEYKLDVQATDPDGDPVAYRLDFAPAGMTIDAATGAIRWTPAADQTGVWRITLVAADGRGGEATQEFDLVVSAAPLNRPPVFATAPVVTAPTGATYVYAPSVSDADGDPLSYTLESFPPGMTVDPATGRIEYPNAAEGNHLVILRADDGRGGSATQRFVLSVGVPSANPGAPVVTSTPSVAASVGNLWAYRPTAFDPQGGALVYGLADAPEGMSLNPVTGQLLWTPTDADVGVHTVRLLVSDGLGGLTEQRFALTVRALAENRAPRIESRPLLAATVGETYVYGLIASDPDGDPLFYELVAGPEGMSVNSSGGLGWAVPADRPLGPVRVLVRVHDGLGGETFQDFYLDVRAANAAPEFTSTAPTTVVAGTVYRYDADAVDSADAVSYSLVSAPYGARIDARTGLVTWKPSTLQLGPQTLVIRATDERGLAADQTVSVTVVPDDSAPEVAVGAPERTLPGETLALRVLASDDVGVVARSLTVNGQPLGLDAGGATQFAPTAPGVYTLVATATDAAGNVGTATRTLIVVDPADVAAPTLQIVSPPSGGTVTYLTDLVGSVADDNLLSWRLEYALLGSDQWTTIAAGATSVADAILGVFDPTLLANDAYVVRLTAEDLGGNVASTEIELDVQGRAKLGEFALEVTDLSIPLAGIPITITRRYSTLEAGRQGDFGYGWSLAAADARIRETVPQGSFEAQQGPLFGAVASFKAGTRVYLTTPDGERAGFTFRPEYVGDGAFGSYYKPAFVADPGVFWTLSTDYVPLSEQPDGAYRIYFTGFHYNPSQYTLTGTDGVAYTFDQFTGLKSVSEPNGNSLAYTRDGIFHSSGQSVQFVRDEAGRIAKIVDPAGKELDYSYDEAGDLVLFTDQEGVGSTYEYDAPRAHYLTEVAEECGCRPKHRVVYDEAGRVIADSDALGHSLGVEYDLAGMVETVRDRLGNETRLRYDERGNILETVDAEGGRVLRTFNADDLIIAVENERGFTSTFEYDPQGNLTRYVDSGSGEWFFAYNELSRLTSTTDALGRTATMVYDVRGNLLETRYADGSVESRTVDRFGRTTSKTDGVGRVTQYGYANDSDLLPNVVTFANGLSRISKSDHFGSLTEVTDELGRVNRFQYDAAGRAIGQTDPLGLTASATYVQSRLTEYTDPRGLTTRWEFDAENRPVREILPDGSVYATEYDAMGRVVRETDPRGVITTYQRDRLGRVTSVTTGSTAPSSAFSILAAVSNDDAIEIAERTVSYRYDAAGNQVSMTDPNGGVWTYEYDSLDRLIRSTDPLGGKVSYTYDAVGNALTFTDEEGRTKSYEYDEVDRLVSFIDALGSRWSYEYNAADELIREMDAEGRVTRYLYDEMGQLVEATDAAGGIRTYVYDEVGNLVSSIDPLGRVTRAVYDDADRLVSVIDALGRAATYEYDENDNLLAATDRLGRTTHFVYDDRDWLASVKDAAGEVTSYERDAMGNVLRATYPEGGVVSYVYDSLGQLTRFTEADGGVHRYEYDDAGNLLATTDPLLRTTSLAYDELHRLVRETDARGAETEYGYDRVGNVTSVTDPLGNVTHFVFDDADRLVERVDPLSRSQFFAYDRVGNLTSRTDRLGRTTTYQHDALNRTTDEVWWSNGTEIRRVEYAYDAVGNLLSIVDPDSAATRTYDALDRLVTHDNLGTPHQPRVVFTYGYDAESNVVSVADNLGGVVESTHDARNQLATRTWTIDGQVAASVTLVHDRDGRLVRLDRHSEGSTSPVVGSTRWSFDAVGRPTAIDHSGANGESLVEYDYVWDQASQLVSESHHGRTTTFAYDAAGQLISAAPSNGSDESYGYDLNGNRTGATYDVGPNNQLLEDDAYTYEYDAEGNLSVRTAKAGGERTEYEYDHRNRLVRVERLSASGLVLQVVEYAWDAFDRQILKRVDGVVERATVYNGVHAWADFAADGEIAARYLHGERVDQLLARWRPDGDAGEVIWHLADHLKTVRDWMDDAGALVGSRDYSSYGLILSETGEAVDDRFGYTGREWDADLGLWQYRARWYDPTSGRFTQTDPLGFAAGDANLYRYVNNAPTWLVDPDGLAVVAEHGKALQPAAKTASQPVSCMQFPGKEQAIRAFLRELCGRDSCGGNRGRWAAHVKTCARTAQARLSMANFGTAAVELQMILKVLLAKAGGKGGKQWVRASIDTLGAGRGREGMRVKASCQVNTGCGCGPGRGGMKEAPRGGGPGLGAGSPGAELLGQLTGGGNCFAAGTAVVVGLTEPWTSAATSTLATAAGGVALVTLASAVGLNRRERERRKDEERRAAELARERLFAERADGLDEDGGSDDEPCSRDDDRWDHDRESSPTDDERRAALADFARWWRDSPAPSAAMDEETSELDAESRGSFGPSAAAVGVVDRPVARVRPAPSGSSSRPASASRSFARSGVWTRVCLALGLLLSLTLGGLAIRSASGPPALSTRPIETIRVGQRVLSENPTGEQDHSLGEVDPATWRHVKLFLDRGEGRWSRIELIRPDWWLEEEGVAATGDEMWLDLPEMDCVGWAAVEAVLPCPPIEPGSGQVVTGSFHHSAGEVLELFVEGLDEPILVTAEHPFWSEGRKAWVPAGELKPREDVGRSRVLRVSSPVAPYQSRETFNLEVAVFHTYAVGPTGLIVHNQSRRGRPRFSSPPGAYWKSGGRCFPTAQNTRVPMQIYTKRGWRTYWVSKSREDSAWSLAAEQRDWCERHHYLADELGKLARKQVEGRMRAAKADPDQSCLKRLLDEFFPQPED